MVLKLATSLASGLTGDGRRFQAEADVPAKGGGSSQYIYIFFFFSYFSPVLLLDFNLNFLVI